MLFQKRKKGFILVSSHVTVLRSCLLRCFIRCLMTEWNLMFTHMGHLSMVVQELVKLQRHLVLMV